jgi:4'-phosphopantetheinyl transferase
MSEVILTPLPNATLFLHELPSLESIPAHSGLHNWLTQDEIAAAAKYVHPTAYAHFVIGRALIRSVLGGILNASPLSLVFNRTPRGRPFIAHPVSPNLDFNLAHSGNWVGLLVAPFRVGLDLEPINRDTDVLNIARAYFSPAEAEWISADPMLLKKRFFSLWTLKEAYLKACGRGLDDSLASIGFTRENEEWFRVMEERSPDAANWRATQCSPVSDLCIAVCQPVTAPVALPVTIRIASPFDVPRSLLDILRSP